MRLSPGALLAAAAMASAAFVGCGGASESGSQDPSEATLEVAYGGCAQARPGPICRLGESDELRIWARRPASDFDIEGDVRILAVEEIQGGKLFRLQPETRTGSLELLAHGEGTESWRLSWEPTVAQPERLTQAMEHFFAGQFDDAHRLLEELLATGAAPGATHRWLGRVERARGDVDAADQELRQALASFEQHGWLLQGASSAAELAYLLIYDAYRIGDSRTLLRRVADGLSDSEAPAEAQYDLAYLRGLLAVNSGDVRSALRWLGRAAEIAERFGWTVLRMTAEQPLAHQLQQVGRVEEAGAIFSRHQTQLPEDLTPCDRALMLNNLGWNQLLIREHGDAASSEDPTPWLEEARSLAATKPCPETDERANVSVNLALAELQRGQPASARRHLEQAAAFEPRPDLRSRFWRLKIEARIAMDEGRPAAALETYRELEWLAGEALSVHTSMVAAAGRAAALEALGRRGEALEAFEDADRHLNAASLAVPIDAGRESFVDRGTQVTRHHVALLVEEGRDQEAYHAARRARSRVLRSLHRQSRLSDLSSEEQAHWDEAISAYRRQRRAFDSASGEDWRLPADVQRRRRDDRELVRERLQAALDGAFATLDELSPSLDSSLPPLAKDEVRLLFFPSRSGWIGFAEGADGVFAKSLQALSEDAEPAALGRILLAPFAPAIESAKRVRILPFGWLRELDFHALPFGNATLLDYRPVLYGLDLPAFTPDASPIPRALIVADPSADLDAARPEGRLVAGEFQRLDGDAAPWTVEHLVADEATSHRVRELLPTVDHFHYAGHGVARGRGGWQSSLLLAADSNLTVTDILALERAPRQVLLSACETARSTADSEVESATGLAHAFLTAGSRSVIAAQRPVEDHIALELVRGYYQAWIGGEPPAEALRHAELALRDQYPHSDWSSFRLLEP